MKRLILLVLFLTALLAGTDTLYAQEEWSTLDTIRVIDSYGNPGDTVIVNLHIANTTLSLGAYSARIVYNNSVMKAINVVCWDRGCPLEATAGDTSQVGIFTVLAYTFNPLQSFIPRGAGIVARMKFYIRPGATPGTIATLSLIDDTVPPIDGINSLADSTGSRLVHPQLVNGNVSIGGGGINQRPVISSIGSQQIPEGQTLQFPVSAHDPDGDPITLSAQSLPANSSFPTVQADSAVTGIFTFSPSFEQGPDTFYVDFVANDDHNNTNRLTVQIIVLDQPNDRIVVNSGQGGVPGATGRAVAVELFNSKPVYGIQYSYQYDQTQIEVMGVYPTERCLGLGFWHSFPEPGKIIVLIFSGGLDPIAAGAGPIVEFITDVNPTALFGRTPVVLDSAIEVIDSIGTSRRLIIEDGYFTVDRFGDANLDENVNVGDCVTIVAFVIQTIQLNTRQFDAADINRDTRVNVADLQSVIDRILLIPLAPGPVPPGDRAIVELLPQVTQVGDLVTIDMWADISTEAAAVQYEMAYDPARLEPISADPGQMVSALQFDNNIAGDKINGVMYNLTGATFGPESGSLVSYTFRLKAGDFRPGDLRITDFMIVNQGAALIPAEVRGQLPSNYALAQNYPNPFNSSTNISFDLPHEMDVELVVYDITGRQVATLINGAMGAGNHVVTWNGRSDSGEEAATGVFFYRLRTSEFDETKKMTLVK